MGSWSKLLAPLFVEFVGVSGEVLDVGCGTESLTFCCSGKQTCTRIGGREASTGFIEYARLVHSPNRNSNFRREVCHGPQSGLVSIQQNF